MTDVKSIVQCLKSMSNQKVAEHSKVFFKTGVGEYAEGDSFLGIRVPVLRKQVKEFRKSSLRSIYSCLKNEFHEIRLFALLSLVDRFKKGSLDERKEIYQHYIQNILYINNWDLVDSSAPHIVGAFLNDKDRKPLYHLAKSDNLWHRRIAIISTHFFIKNDDYQDCFKLSELLLNDTQDLIHKAVGWMLREVGKRSRAEETAFLINHYRKMPRTMLRYAIEHYPEIERKAFLKGVA